MLTQNLMNVTKGVYVKYRKANYNVVIMVGESFPYFVLKIFFSLYNLKLVILQDFLEPIYGLLPTSSDNTWEYFKVLVIETEFPLVIRSNTELWPTECIQMLFKTKTKYLSLTQLVTEGLGFESSVRDRGFALTRSPILGRNCRSVLSGFQW